MALFDGKAKQEAAENEVLQKLSQVPLLNNLIETVFHEEDERWILQRQSYYDKGKREVFISPDCFEIIWRSYHDEVRVGNDGQRRSQEVEDVHGRVGYSFTKSGYMPLHGYKYDNGTKEINTGRICFLWASIIRERLMARLPECQFSDVVRDANGDGAHFSYVVPPLTFKDWF